MRVVFDDLEIRDAFEVLRVPGDEGGGVLDCGGRDRRVAIGSLHVPDSEKPQESFSQTSGNLPLETPPSGQNLIEGRKR